MLLAFAFAFLIHAMAGLTINGFPRFGLRKRLTETRCECDTAALHTSSPIAFNHFPKLVNWILYAREKDNCGDHERFVTGFSVCCETVGFEYVFCHLTLFATHSSDVSRQAMHIQSFTILRQRHFLLITLPVPEPRVVFKTLFLES